MALSIEECKEIIRVEKNAHTETSGIKFLEENGSAVGTANLWADLHALASNLLSQLFDKFQVETTTAVYNNFAAVPAWIRSKILAFQTGDFAQIDLETYKVAYPTIDTTKQIITSCSVKTSTNNTVNIKVAKSSGKISDDEKTELTAYYDLLNPAGIKFNILSYDADLLYVNANVFYNGQYESVIKENVKAGITAFLKALPFDGALLVTDLEQAIRDVEGVKDVVFINLYARPSSTAFVSATKLINNYTLVPAQRKYESIAGYMIPENETGYTLDDSLTFTVDA